MTRLIGGPTALSINLADAEVSAGTPSVRRVMAGALLLLFVGCGGLLAWAALAPIERAVVARGNLVAEGRRKSILLSEPGILQALLVREGQRVATGEVLLRLDPTVAEATAAQARAQSLTQGARVARLRAEQAGQRRFAPPAELAAAARGDPALAAILEAEQRLFTARWEAFDGNVSVAERRIAVERERLAAAMAQRAATERRLASIRADLSGLRPLAQQGFARIRELREFERLESQAVGDIGALRAQEAQFQQSIAQAELELSTFRLTRAQDIARDLQDAQQLLVDAEQRLLAAANVRARRDILAPEPGIVTDIRFVTPGSSITDGQPVLDLLPVDDRLIVEAKVSPNDVEQLQVGGRVKLRLLALRARTTPLLAGELTYVSADQQTDAQGNAFFLARARIDPAGLALIPDLRLNAGMPVELFVLGETRSALDYLLAPIRDSMRRALRD
jgi:HlyD family secretion protein